MEIVKVDKSTFEGLVGSILDWWEEHQYDVYTDGGKEEDNVYPEEPEFVKKAKGLNNRQGGK